MSKKRSFIELINRKPGAVSEYLPKAANESAQSETQKDPERDRSPDQDPSTSGAVEASLAEPSNDASPAASLAVESSLASETRPADRARAAQEASLAVQSRVDILAGLPETAGYLQIPNRLIDHLFPQLTPDQQAVYLHLYRLSHGFGKDTCHISLPGLHRRTKVSERQASRVLSSLMSLGLVQKIGEIRGKAKQQGMILRVAAPAGQDKEASLAKTARPDKEARLAPKSSNKDLKNKYLKIARDLSESYVGASTEELMKAVRRRCEQNGYEWIEEIWREIVG